MNKNCEYGRRYNFADIHSIEDYQRMVPLSTYEDYAPYVDRMIRHKEKNLMFTGPNGNNLFLPATGMLWGKGLGGVGADGYYWSRTLYNYPNDAFILIFKSNVLSYWDCSYRSIGLTVRAVRASN